MPQVPLPSVPDSTSRTPQVTAPQGVVPVQDATGQQIQQGGAALSALGSSMTDIATKLNEDHALATSKGGMNQWTEIADRIDQGYQAEVGQAASQVDGVGVDPGVAPKSALDRMESEMRRVEDGMSSDLAKRVFRQAAERRMVAYSGRLRAHEMKQIKVHAHAEGVAAMGVSAKNYITLGPLGPDDDFGDAMAEARGLADESELGPEARKAFLLKVKTGMHAGFVSTLLASGETADADSALRAIEKGDIDVTERQKLRTKIDGVMSAEKVEKLAVDIVNNQGHRTHKDRVQAAAIAMPKVRQDQIAKESVLVVARKMGIPEKDLKELESSGGWRTLMSNPQVVAQMDKAIMTDADEILAARYPGQPPAGFGTIKRSMATAQKLYERGEIDAGELRDMQSMIEQQVNRNVRVRNTEASETLQQTENILQNNRQTGGPTSIDSPQFKSQNPNVYERLVSQGLLSQGRGLTKSVFDRVTDPAYYDKLQTAHASGELSRVSFDELFATYYPHFNKTAWNEAQRLWSSHNQGATEGKLTDDPVVKWEDSLKQWLGARGEMTGKDRKTGLPFPTTPEQQQNWLDMQRDLGKAVSASGREWSNDDVLKWAGARELDKITSQDLRGWDSETVMRRADLLADIRRAEAAGDETEALRLRNSIVVESGDDLIRTARLGKQARGTEADPIPDRASLYIRDMWRLSQLRGMPGYSDTDRRLTAAGAGSVDTLRDGKTIEAEFSKYGLQDSWPTIQEQMDTWNDIRGLLQKTKPLTPSWGRETLKR